MRLPKTKIWLVTAVTQDNAIRAGVVVDATDRQYAIWQAIQAGLLIRDGERYRTRLARWNDVEQVKRWEMIEDINYDLNRFLKD